MTLPAPLVAHLTRVYPDLIAASYPQPLELVLSYFERFPYGVDYADRPRAHWLLTRSPETPHRAEVSVAVERSERGYGLGPSMLRAAESHAQQMGCSWLTGWAWGWNTVALKMDREFGFEQVGRLDDAYRLPSGKSYDMVLLAKRID